jgi:isoquinoline 1-oxidoreductase beta subunit
MKTLSRRTFLQKSLAGAGLTIAVCMTPFGTRLLSAAEAEKEEGLFSPNVWVQITAGNMVNVVVNKSEMGQGVYTSLPMIVADELDADWKQVRLKVAPAADRYKDPAWGRQLTGGSTSIRHMFDPLRKAGAAAREMLVEAAAKTWGIPVSECAASEGSVRNTVTGKKISFGDLALTASKLPVPTNPVLKKEGSFHLIGRPLARLDIPAKTHGTAQFGIDTFVPGMLYAAIERPPAYGAKPVSYDSDAAMKIKGVSHVLKLPDGIAVCAEFPDTAWKARAALKVEWDKGTEPGLDNESLEKKFMGNLEKKGVIARKDGDAGEALGKVVKKNDVTYLLPYLYHATMEPMDCVADVRKDRCEIWVPTQNQTGILEFAVKETGLKPEQIHVRTTYLGGGYGRRSETDVVEEAVKISKAAGKPVKLIWKREEDVKNDFYRPGNCSRVQGGLDEKGNLIAWSHRIVCPSIFARAMPAMMKNGIDPGAMDCLQDLEYEVPHFTVEYVRIDTPVPVGFWRSVGASHNAFTIESFVDEMAHLAGKDPLEFRLGLLKNHHRAHRLLEVVADLAGWGKSVKKGAGRGIAWSFAFGTYVAQVAEVSIDRKKGTIRVNRVVAAVDCGPVVNPAIITSQIKGAIIMGLSAALKERVNFAKGGVSSSNFDDYHLLRMSEIPETMDVHVIKSNAAHGGIGEPGLPPIAPAVANAVFNATGARLRNLPMTPEAVKKALKKV